MLKEITASALALTSSLISVAAFAEDQTTTTRTESSSTSNSTLSGSSSSATTTTTTTTTSTSPGLRTEKPSIGLQPKFKKRISDIADQIDMALSKGFISSDEASGFKQRQLQLLSMDEEYNKKGSAPNLLVEIERTITVLNADMYRAMNKDKAAPLPEKSSEKTPAASDKSTEGSDDTKKTVDTSGESK